MKKFFEEFKKFIARGNVMDLAVAVIMGGAFGKIVTSLVNDILMPLIGILIGQNFSSLSVTIRDSVITYGAFIQNIVDFLIISFCIFIITKIMNKITPKKEEPKPTPPAKSEDVKLLEEIRDLLKKENNKKNN